MPKQGNRGTAAKFDKQVSRDNRDLKPVRLGLTRVAALAQRALRPYWVNEIFSKFDLDALGAPEVSHRDGYYYIMDGQHRIEALKMWLGEGWEDQYVLCWVATGLSEQDEARVFRMLNHKLNVNTFQDFKVALTAGSIEETDIARVVALHGLTIAANRKQGGICAVSTLKKVYQRNGPATLGRALGLISKSFGDAGLDAAMMDGFGLLCHRYNGVLDEKSAAIALASMHGGANGLLNAANVLREKTGSGLAHCIAAASVTVINKGRKGGSKLPDWWKQ